MKPNAYRPAAPSAQSRRERPQLTLIPGDGKRRRLRGPLLLTLAAVGIAAVCFQMLRSRSTHSESASLLQQNFSQLTSVYQKEGMLTFLEAKARLKMQVADALQERDPAAYEFAENLAVYLFPDLLPDDDFERSVALDGWAGAESTIESSARGAQSRNQYQSLQAAIWQYENPDAKNPALSPIASGVLKIYQTISSP